MISASCSYASFKHILFLTFSYFLQLFPLLHPTPFWPRGSGTKMKVIIKVMGDYEDVPITSFSFVFVSFVGTRFETEDVG